MVIGYRVELQEGDLQDLEALCSEVMSSWWVKDGEGRRELRSPYDNTLMRQVSDVILLDVALDVQ